MPLYEYQCENCGDRFELIEKFSAEPLTIHEKCGGKVHRLISAPALMFKGSGWYVTDYAKSGSLPPGNGGGKKDGEGSSEKGSSDKSSSEKGGSSEKKDAAKSSSDSNSSSSSNSDSPSSNSTSATSAPASSSDKK
jgi:putative FmdB family regulatory protein